MHRPTYAEIDLNAIRENIQAIRRAVGPGVRIMPAVKADGYGHGAVKVGRTVLAAGANMLGVASVEEALEFRNSGIDAPILILGCSSGCSAREIVEFGISATVCDLSAARDLAAEAARCEKKARVHVKVDTGMGRIGVSSDGAVDLVTALMGFPQLEVEGIFTHFPSSDESDRSFTEEQIRLFKGIISELSEHDIRPEYAHAANSGAVLDYPSAYLDMVRPGIAVYGLYPSSETGRSIQLKPALTFRTKIVFMKDYPAGRTVSYGRAFETLRSTRAAVIPVGYADGFERSLSNKGEVSVKGYRAPVIGRVCMDQTMIDVTDVPDVAIGDDVILLGGGVDYLSVERVAELLGTIPHDVVTSIGKRVPRVYTGE
ncbi:MAG: alanine racemase [Armatimonadota bacterium]